VHTGSRGPGQAAFRHHRNVILRGQDFDRTGHLKAQRRIEKQFPNKTSVERRDALEKLRLQHLAAVHPPYLEGNELYAYYLDLLLMQTFGRWNRKLITRRIVTEVLDCEYHDPDADNDDAVSAPDFVESVHNAIDFTDFHVRKGAVAAYTHRRAIVSINMAQGCWIVRALRDDPDTNFSAPHGLGREVERGAAPPGGGSLRERLQAFAREMKDIVADVNPHTLDEAPAAYKSPDLVRESLLHHVTIEAQLVPLINIKG
jgi:tRNA-splicing ligase RtcB